MSYYRYILDGTEVTEARGWDTFQTSVKRDRQKRGITVTQDGTLSFVGDGYDYLLSLKLNSGYTVTVDLLILQSLDEGVTWNEFYRGLIFLSDVEFDEKQLEAKTKIVDNGYYAKINNNSTVPFAPYGSQSKNGVAIDAIPEYDLELFEPSSGTYYTITRPVGGEKAFTCYKVYDLLRYAVEWMTDGELTFESSVLDDGGEFGYYVITIGRVLENGDPNIVYVPPISYPGVTEDQWRSGWGTIKFDELLKNVSLRFNLWWAIQETTSGKVFRLEKETYWRSSGNLYTITAIDELKCRVNPDLLYGTISFGQGEVDETATLSFPETIEFIGFKDEDYPLLTESNTAKNTLDLKTTWIASSNVIESMLINGLEVDRDFDGKKFIIECTDNAGAMRAVGSNNLDGSGAVYYNQTLTNARIASRFLGSVPSSIALYLGEETGYFVAEGGANTIIVSISGAADFDNFISLSANGNIGFDNDYDQATYESPNTLAGSLLTATSDPDGVYGGATVQGSPVADADSYFTAPASGRYGFIAGTVFDYTYGANHISSDISLKAYVTDNVGAYLYDVTIATIQAVSGFNNIEGSAYINLNSGERVYIYLYGDIDFDNTLPPTSVTVQAFYGRYFACTSTQTGGGIYQNYDPASVPVYNYEFDYPISEMDSRDFVNSSNLSITFSRENGIVRRGWIETMKYNHKTNVAKFILASKDR